MGLYLYAFVDLGEPESAPPPGVGGAAVRVIRAGRVGAVCSEYADRPPDASAASLWRHERVVEAFMDGRGILPVRYGTVLSDERVLAAKINERVEELLAGLERVRAKVELAVRAVWHAERGASPVVVERQGDDRPGRTYLLNRLETTRRERAAAATLHEPLAELATESAVRVEGDPPMLKGSYLVDADSVDEFRDRVARLTAAHDGVTLACTGPWPPYSFVGKASWPDV